MTHSLYSIGFSHQWTELSPSDRTQTILLLQDSIEWLVINVFPRIYHLLPQASLNKIDDANNKDKHVEQIQRRWFIENYIVVCSLFNRIVKCLPWCYIEALDLLKKSVMSKEILLVVYQARLWLIDRACKNCWVVKEVVIGNDFKNIITIMLVPLLYILISHCTGGAHSILKTASRLVTPGFAECHVLLPMYYVHPYTADVYSSRSHGTSGFAMSTQYDKAVHVLSQNEDYQDLF